MTAVEELELDTLPAATREVALPELEIDDVDTAAPSSSSQEIDNVNANNVAPATAAVSMPRIVSGIDSNRDCLLFRLLEHLYMERELDAEFW